MTGPLIWPSGSPVAVEWLDTANQKNPAKECWGNVVDVPSGKPLLGGERRLKELQFPEGMSE